MEATLKTKEQFLDEGFKADYPYWYKGTKREPEAKIKYHFLENLAGKSVKIIDVEDSNRGTVIVQCDELTYTVETWMFAESIKFNQILRPQTIKISGKDAQFYGVSFRFNCRHSELLLEDARKLAKWVLRVAKDAPK